MTFHCRSVFEEVVPNVYVDHSLDCSLHELGADFESRNLLEPLRNLGSGGFMSLSLAFYFSTEPSGLFQICFRDLGNVFPS